MSWRGPVFARGKLDSLMSPSRVTRGSPAVPGTDSLNQAFVPSTQRRLGVCIATFRRPQRLRELLIGLAAQRFANREDVAVVVAVADNDPLGGGCAVCNEEARGYPWPLRCRVEPRQGISQARNASLALVGTDADFVAFIDDDERPDPDWLENLLLVQREYDADVVTGPVLPILDPQTPNWVVRGRFFERPRYETGKTLPIAKTGNALVRMSLLASMPEPFDPRFGSTGAEDTELFRRLNRAGARIVWADSAVVREHVPTLRTSVRWLVRRAWRVGYAYAIVELCQEPRLRTRPLRLLKGFARMLEGLAWLPLGWRRERLVRAMQGAAFGAGMVLGALRPESKTSMRRARVVNNARLRQRRRDLTE